MRHLLIALVLAPALVGAQLQPEKLRILVGGDDDRGAALGAVKQIVLVNAGVVVLERDAPFIRYFSLDGRLRQSFGRAGAGPGEYRSPTALAVDSVQKALWVIDPQNARLTRYRVADTLALEQGYGIDVPMVRGACTVAGQVIALAGLDSTLLHPLSILNGRLVGAPGFGAKTSQHRLAQHPLLRSHIGDGPLTCIPSRDQLYVASSLLGEVLMVRRGGDGRTTLLRIPDAQLIALDAVGAGLRFSLPPAGYYERIVALREISDALEVTLERREVIGRAEVAAGYRRVVLQPNGALGRMSMHRWQLVGTTAGQAICYRPDPVPTIGALTGASCP